MKMADDDEVVVLLADPKYIKDLDYSVNLAENIKEVICEPVGEPKTDSDSICVALKECHVELKRLEVCVQDCSVASGNVQTPVFQCRRCDRLFHLACLRLSRRPSGCPAICHNCRKELTVLFALPITSAEERNFRRICLASLAYALKVRSSLLERTLKWLYDEDSTRIAPAVKRKVKRLRVLTDDDDLATNQAGSSRPYCQTSVQKRLLSSKHSLFSRPNNLGFQPQGIHRMEHLNRIIQEHNYHLPGKRLVVRQGWSPYRPTRSCASDRGQTVDVDGPQNHNRLRFALDGLPGIRVLHEKRRRSEMNGGFKELRMSIPKLSVFHHASDKLILRSATTFIKGLEKTHAALDAKHQRELKRQTELKQKLEHLRRTTFDSQNSSQPERSSDAGCYPPDTPCAYPAPPLQESPPPTLETNETHSSTVSPTTGLQKKICSEFQRNMPVTDSAASLLNDEEIHQINKDILKPIEVFRLVNRRSRDVDARRENRLGEFVVQQKGGRTITFDLLVGEDQTTQQFYFRSFPSGSDHRSDAMFAAPLTATESSKTGKDSCSRTNWASRGLKKGSMLKITKKVGLSTSKSPTVGLGSNAHTRYPPLRTYSTRVEPQGELLVPDYEDLSGEDCINVESDGEDGGNSDSGFWSPLDLVETNLDMEAIGQDC